MKPIFTFILSLCFVLNTFAQTGVYVKYDISIQANGEQAEMMKSMFEGSTMELAANADRTWVKSQVGTMMTTEMEMDVAKNEMTMYMGGAMGKMAFRGNADKLEDMQGEETESPNVELLDETKTILGVVCKKAVIKDEDGNSMSFWYTEEFERPEGMEQMPNEIPGLCLEFEMFTEGIKMVYTASAFKDDANMADYTLTIPEGVEVQSFDAMKAMGMGGN